MTTEHTTFPTMQTIENTIASSLAASDGTREIARKLHDFIAPVFESHERNLARQTKEIEQLHATLTTDENQPLCSCAPIDGMEEDCLTHGRTKAELWTMLAAANQRADDAEQRADDAAAGEWPRHGDVVCQWGAGSARYRVRNPEPDSNGLVEVTVMTGPAAGGMKRIPLSTLYRPADTGDGDADLRRKVAEINRLNQELTKTQEELDRISTAHAELRKEHTEFKRVARRGEAIGQIVALVQELGAEGSVTIDGIRIGPIETAKAPF